MPSPSEVAAVREFNRYYTAQIGVLTDGLLHTAYTLTEARLLYELARRDAAEVVDLRRDLGLDAGYLSRILTRFAADGLVERGRSAADGRRQVVRLTGAGKDAAADIDARSAGEIADLLDRLGADDRRRLLGGMTAIREVLDRVPREETIVLRPPEPGDLGWIVARHGALYAAEYGWDLTFEGLVAGIVAAYPNGFDPAREAGWIAEIDGRPVGCVLCVRDDDRTARLRVLLVEPSARGTGLGSRLVAECVRFARRAGYRRMVLLTYSVLADARRIYQRAGFTLTSEAAERAYGHDLVAQTWTLDL